MASLPNICLRWPGGLLGFRGQIARFWRASLPGRLRIVSGRYFPQETVFAAARRLTGALCGNHPPGTVTTALASVVA